MKKKSQPMSAGKKVAWVVLLGVLVVLLGVLVYTFMGISDNTDTLRRIRGAR